MSSTADTGPFERSVERATYQIIQKLLSNTNKACLVIENTARKEAPVDMGQLRASINHNVTLSQGGIDGTIGTNLTYAPFVHNGTGIYAKDGNGRKTPWKYVVKRGKYKGVHVTRGQRPNDFMKRAREQNAGKIRDLLSE